mmetsp:Transcript_33149/g.93865  ORF Transcript_33149/g.93865 Transcript_33149/m.93865 type:complete len:222 (-) Transcript_33149:1834-2499(-)
MLFLCCQTRRVLSDMLADQRSRVSVCSTLTSMFTQLLWPARRCTGVMLCVSHTVTDGSWPQAQTWLRPMGTSVRMRSVSVICRRHCLWPVTAHSRIAPSSEPLHTPWPATTIDRTPPVWPSNTAMHSGVAVRLRISHTRIVWSSEPLHKVLPTTKRHFTPLVCPDSTAVRLSVLACHAQILKSSEPVNTRRSDRGAMVDTMQGTPPWCQARMFAFSYVFML